MIYRQPYIIVSALHINDKATVSTCQADQMHFFFFSAQDEKIQRRRKRVISGPDLAVNFNPSKLFFFFRSITFIIRALTCLHAYIQSLEVIMLNPFLPMQNVAIPNTSHCPFESMPQSRKFPPLTGKAPFGLSPATSIRKSLFPKYLPV